MLRGFGLEELDTFFAQSQSNLGILNTCRRIVTDRFILVVTGMGAAYVMIIRIGHIGARHQPT